MLETFEKFGAPVATPDGYTRQLQPLVEAMVRRHARRYPMRFDKLETIVEESMLENLPQWVKDLPPEEQPETAMTLGWKYSADARHVTQTAPIVSHTEMFLQVLDAEVPLEWQSPHSIASLGVYKGSDDGVTMNRNFGSMFNQVVDLKNKGVIVEVYRPPLKRKRTHDKEDIHSTPPVEDQRPKKRRIFVNCDLKWCSDMKTNWGSFGVGGLKDSNKMFCSHCDEAVPLRHMLYRMVQTSKEGNVNARQFFLDHQMYPADGYFLNCQQGDIERRMKSCTIPDPSRSQDVPPVKKPVLSKQKWRKAYKQGTTEQLMEEFEAEMLEWQKYVDAEAGVDRALFLKLESSLVGILQPAREGDCPCTGTNQCTCPRCGIPPGTWVRVVRPDAGGLRNTSCTIHDDPDDGCMFCAMARFPKDDAIPCGMHCIMRLTEALFSPIMKTVIQVCACAYIMCLRLCVCVCNQHS